MKKWTLLLCLLVASTAAQAQFEKGKWFVSPGLTGLNLSYDTGMDKASFGLNVKGGAFVLDNVERHAELLEDGRYTDANVYIREL